MSKETMSSIRRQNIQVPLAGTQDMTIPFLRDYGKDALTAQARIDAINKANSDRAIQRGILDERAAQNKAINARADAAADRQQAIYDRENREREAKSKIESLILHGDIAPTESTISGERRLPTTKEGIRALGEERKGVYDQGIAGAAYTDFNTPANLKLATDYSTAQTAEQTALRDKPQTEAEVNVDEQKALAELDILKNAGTITTENYNIGKRSIKAAKKTNLDAIDASTDEVPRYYDWRTKSYVGPTEQNKKDIDLVKRRVEATKATDARKKAETAYNTALRPVQRKNVDSAIKAGSKALTQFDKKFVDKKLTTPEYRAKVLKYGSSKAKELKLSKEETSVFLAYLKGQISTEVASKNVLKERIAEREDFKFEEGVKSTYDKELEATKSLNRMTEAADEYALKKETGGLTDQQEQDFKEYTLALKGLANEDLPSGIVKEYKRILRRYNKKYLKN